MGVGGEGGRCYEVFGCGVMIDAELVLAFVMGVGVVVAPDFGVPVGVVLVPVLVGGMGVVVAGDCAVPVLLPVLGL